MAGTPLNSAEISALVDAIEDGRVETTSAPAKEAVPYDLTSNDRAIRGQMPALDAINAQIASMLGMGLAGRTRRRLEVVSAPATLLKIGDLGALLSPPATVAVLRLGQGVGQAVLSMEASLTDGLLSAALGEKKPAADPVTAPSAPVDRRDLTSVERQVLKRLLGVFTEAMGTAWEPVLALRPEIVRFESDPRLLQIAPSNETAVLCSFEISGGLRGAVQLAIPYAALEPAKRALMAAPRQGDRFSDVVFAERLAEELSQVPVELRALLGQARTRLSRLLELEVGDTFMLDTSEGSALPVLVEGRAKLFGQPGVRGGAMSVTVERVAKPIQIPPSRTKRTA